MIKSVLKSAVATVSGFGIVAILFLIYVAVIAAGV
jgi:hypothetical protein